MENYSNISHLDPGLGEGVVVLYAVEDHGEAPEAVGLDGVPGLEGEGLHLEVGRDVLLVVECVLEEHQEEGGDEVVDALDVPGGGVPDGPDVQDPLVDLLNTALLEQAHHGAHSRNVDVDLPVRVLVNILVLRREILIDIPENDIK